MLFFLNSFTLLSRLSLSNTVSNIACKIDEEELHSVLVPMHISAIHRMKKDLVMSATLWLLLDQLYYVAALASPPLGSLWLLLDQLYYVAALASSPLGSLWLWIAKQYYVAVHAPSPLGSLWLWCHGGAILHLRFGAALTLIWTDGRTDGRTHRNLLTYLTSRSGAAPSQ